MSKRDDVDTVGAAGGVGGPPDLASAPPALSATAPPIVLALPPTVERKVDVTVADGATRVALAAGKAPVPFPERMTPVPVAPGALHVAGPDSAHGSNLADAVLAAYSHHRTLVLAPDDVWLVIAQGAGVHIVKNAEAYRGVFVQHSGKKTLTASGDSGWEAGVADLCDQIATHTASDVVGAFVADFSTTTPVALTASRVVVMGAMREYFSYRMEMLCGIPAVELRGTRADWAKLGDKVARLGAMLLPAEGVRVGERADGFVRRWLAGLGDVAARLLATFDGAPDLAWWSNVASQQCFGSGSRRYDGWLADLFLYDASGRLAMGGFSEQSDFPKGFTEVPFGVSHGGSDAPHTLLAGSAGFVVREADGAVVPRLFWAVRAGAPKPADDGVAVTRGDGMVTHSYATAGGGSMTVTMFV